MTGQPYAGGASSPASRNLPEAKADGDRVVAELASRIGTLGVEVADIAGNLEEVTSRISNQAAQFEELEQSAAKGGYLPTHNPNYSRPQGKDAARNAANCRNRRIFNDRAVQKVAANTKPFLLQTYRRNMGGIVVL